MYNFTVDASIFLMQYLSFMDIKFGYKIVVLFV